MPVLSRALILVAALFVAGPSAAVTYNIDMWSNGHPLPAPDWVSPAGSQTAGVWDYPVGSPLTADGIRSGAILRVFDTGFGGSTFNWSDDPAARLSDGRLMTAATLNFYNLPDGAWDLVVYSYATDGTHPSVGGTPLDPIASGPLIDEIAWSRYSVTVEGGTLALTDWGTTFLGGFQLTNDLVPVPLPPAAGLLGAALFGVGFAARRRTPIAG